MLSFLFMYLTEVLLLSPIASHTCTFCNSIQPKMHQKLHAIKMIETAKHDCIHVSSLGRNYVLFTLNSKPLFLRLIISDQLFEKQWIKK